MAGGSFWNYNASVGAAELGERLAALVAAGADVTALYPPLVAKCMLGDAHAAYWRNC